MVGKEDDPASYWVSFGNFSGANLLEKTSGGYYVWHWGWLTGRWNMYPQDIQSHLLGFDITGP